MDVLSRFYRSLKSKPAVFCPHILAHSLKDCTWRCPSCGCLKQEDSGAWPGLPAGLKFEPSDEQVIRHLRSRLGIDSCVPHPLLDDFSPTLEASQGICYTHPEKLPGISRDGSKRHFFHRHAKLYEKGQRKCWRIEDDWENRWHKTGKTRQVFVDGKHLGFKKIFVLYSPSGKKGESHKTNWVMHQYHLVKGEKEKDDELLVSKIFYQKNNSRAHSKTAAKEAATETCKSNTLAATNSQNFANKETVAETCSSCSLGIASLENNKKLCKVGCSDATSKLAIASANSWTPLKNETDDGAIFGGIEQSSSLMNKGCSLPNEGKDFTEWLQFYSEFKSDSEFFHNINSSNSFSDFFPFNLCSV